MLQARHLSLRIALGALAAVLVLAPPAAYADTLRGDDIASLGDRGDEERKKDKKNSGDKKGGGEGATGEGANGDKPKEKPFDEIVKDYEKTEGLFTIWHKKDEPNVYLEIKPDQLNKVFLINETLETGTGEGFLLAGAMIDEFPIEFRKIGKNIQLVHKNVMFRADENKPVSRAVRKGFTDSILGFAKIESAPHPETGSLLVNLGEYFLTDFVGLSQALKTMYQTGYSFDKKTSSFGMLKSFPENTEIETYSVYKTGVPKVSYTIPDPRSMMLTLRYSISALKDTGYMPRLADDRVGHFLTMFQDYSDDSRDEAEVRYVNRWDLRKKDPLAAMSEPMNPVVFWIENNVPMEYREAIKDGVEVWNGAFEKIGFKNAIQAKIMPDDAEWDPADVRYSTIRWIVAPGAGFAQGPSRANPYTGQLYDADIRFANDMMRFVKREFVEEVKPVALQPTGSFEGLPRASRHRMFRNCDFMNGAIQQAAFGWDMLAIRGVPQKNSQEAKQYLRDFIVHVTAHEVGHTLGLRHNFKASRIHQVSELHDKSITEPKGVTGSVMDYTPVNLAPEGTPQGQYWQTTLGTYDYWAIEYAYKPIEDAERPEDELPELEKIASRAADPYLAYGTDEDAFGFSVIGIDPLTNMWDIGADTVTYYTGRLGNVNELWTKMEATFEKPGMPYQKLRDVFSRGLGEHFLAGMNVTKIIGGIYHHRDHIGDPDGRLPFVPVPAAEQRRALAFLQKNIFGPDAMKFDPKVLDKLAIDRMPDLYYSIYSMSRLDFPIHNVMLSIQSAPLSRLFSPITMQRITDIELRGGGAGRALRLDEVFSGVREAIWDEVSGRRNISSFRRNLQRRHLDYMIALYTQPSVGAPEDARTLAFAELKGLRDGINSALRAGSGLDRITRAHLEETSDRITKALEAPAGKRLFPKLG